MKPNTLFVRITSTMLALLLSFSAILPSTASALVNTANTSSSTISSPAKSGIYTPKKSDLAQVERFKRAQNTKYRARVKAVGSVKANKEMTTYSAYLARLQGLNARTPRLFWLYGQYRIYTASLGGTVATSTPIAQPTTPVVEKPVVVTTVVPVASPAVTASLNPVSQTATLSAAQQSEVATMVGSDAWFRLSVLEKNAKLRSLGIGENDFGFFYSREGILYSVFTRDIYPAEFNGNGGGCGRGGDCDLADQYDRLDLRLVYKGDIFFQKKDPEYVQKARVAWAKVTNGSPYSQDYMKALFDKVGLTYTIQTKPYYDSGWDVTQIDEYARSIRNGQPKK
jgi:hypothetical protein